MRRLALAVAALCATLLAPVRPARAQSSAIVYVFSTVDAVSANAYGGLDVTGILQGEATPGTRSFAPYSIDAHWMWMVGDCERKALLAMAKPGQYLLRIEREDGWVSFTCTLARAAP